MKFSIEELSKKTFSMSLQYGKVTYTMKSNGKELEIDFIEDKDVDDYVVFDKEKGVYKTNNIDNVNDATTKFILNKDDVNKLFLYGKLNASKNKALLDDIEEFKKDPYIYFDKDKYEQIFGKYKPMEITEEVKEFNNKFNKKLKEKKDKTKEEKQNG